MRLSEIYTLSHDFLSGSVLMVDQIRANLARLSTVPNKMDKVTKVVKKAPKVGKVTQSVPWKFQPRAQSQLAKLLGGRMLSLLAVVASADQSISGTKEGDRSAKMVGAITLAVNAAMLFFPPSMVVNIAVNLLFMLWFNATKEDAMGEFVKKSLWYQGDDIGQPTLQTTRQVDLRGLLIDNYVPYLQEYLGQEYSEQSPWVDSQMPSVIAEINHQALTHWQAVSDKHGYFRDYAKLTDFLLANYLSPEPSEAADERRVRLSYALEYEINHWLGLHSPYYIGVEKKRDSVCFCPSEALKTEASSVVVFIKNSRGQWGKTSLPVVPKSGVKNVLAMPSESISYPYNETDERDRAIKTWWQEVVFVYSLPIKDSEGKAQEERLYFRVQGKVNETTDNATPTFYNPSTSRFISTMNWPTEVMRATYTPNGEREALLTGEQPLSLDLGIDEYGHVGSTNGR